MKEKIITCVSLIFVLAVFIYAAVYVASYKKKTGTEAENAGAAEAVWYNEPVRKMYNSKGKAVLVSANDTEKYEAGGWNAVPPEREGMELLRGKINEYISSRSGEWGVYIKNLKTREYFSINEHDYSSASLIKLFTAAAVYNEIEAGTLDADDNITSNLKLMICESSNTACNYLTKRLGGGDTIKGFDTENQNTSSLGCQYTTHGSELVDGSGRVTFTGFNKTSPRDCGILLEKVYYGTLVSEKASASMLDLLLKQTHTWKIPAGVPDGITVANKTGETDTTEGDAAIVYSPSCSYIICVIGNGSMSSGIETIRNVSKMTYDYLNE